jgi:quercetin dioxygenase-like cupin family protein
MTISSVPVDDLIEEIPMPILPAPAAPTHELPGARFTTLAAPSRGCAETAVCTVEVLPGVEPAPHQVTREEIFVGLAGEALVVLGGDEHALREGDTLVVPAGITFAIAAAGAAPFRAIVCLPVGGQAVMPGGEPFTPPWAA